MKYILLIIIIVCPYILSAQINKGKSLLDLRRKIISELIVKKDCIIDSVIRTPFESELQQAKLTNDVHFTNATFKGVAQFYKVTFAGKYNSFQRAKFESGADFVFDTFQHSALFKQANFKEAFFGQARFYAVGMFDNARFTKPISYNGCYFEKGAIFTGTNFDTADIWQSYFGEWTSFVGTKFAGPAVFSASIFKKDVDFSWSKFHDRVKFDAVTFNQEAAFYADTFNETLDFSGAHLFSDSSTFDFRNTIFPDTIIFAGISKIYNDIDLTTGYFKEDKRYDRSSNSFRKDKRHWISLYKSDISKFHIDYLHFRLLLIDVKSGLELPVDEATTQYESLLKNFKDRGQQESYELLDIEYNDYKWKHNKSYSWFGFIPRYWNKYGYRKDWIFGWTFLFIVFFTIVTFFFLNELNSKVYRLEKIPNVQSIRITSFRGVVSRIWYSFIYTATIFFLFSLRVDKIDFKYKRGTFYLVSVYTIGLICLAYIANFILQK